MPVDWINALVGGLLIGVSVSLMLLWNGRVTGISGIFYQLIWPFQGPRDEVTWRACFIGGLVLGGVSLSFFYPQMFEGGLETANWTLVVAGLLVGFGTSLGSGCTSGHGVCGLSRLSIRSLVATLTFMAVGILSVVAFRGLGVFV